MNNLCKNGFGHNNITARFLKLVVIEASGAVAVVMGVVLLDIGCVVVVVAMSLQSR